MRWILAILALFQCALVLGADRDTANEEGTVVILETALGEITIAVYDQRAPKSAASFLEYVDTGSYGGASFYRVVSPENDHGTPVISVVQGGILDPGETGESVDHETTQDTGIRHTNGTVSLARAEPGTGSGAAFFICIGDQPALDFGGQRNPDGLGFAAFGQVIDGMDVVQRIHSMPAEGAADSPYVEGQMLSDPVEIVAARRVE